MSFDEVKEVRMQTAIYAAVPGAQLAVIDGAAQLSVIEQPQAFEVADGACWHSFDTPEGQVDWVWCRI